MMVSLRFELCLVPIIYLMLYIATTIVIMVDRIFNQVLLRFSINSLLLLTVVFFLSCQ